MPQPAVIRVVSKQKQHLASAPSDNVAADDDDRVGALEQPPTVEGSHEELMYAVLVSCFYWIVFTVSFKPTSQHASLFLIHLSGTR
jgi:hypothetical protein